MTAKLWEPAAKSCGGGTTVVRWIAIVHLCDNRKLTPRAMKDIGERILEKSGYGTKENEVDIRSNRIIVKMSSGTQSHKEAISFAKRLISGIIMPLQEEYAEKGEEFHCVSSATV